MIKNFENFVNEGFLDSIAAGIDGAIGAFKANRNAEKAADADLRDMIDGYANDFSGKAKATMLVKQLVQRAAWFADGFSYDDIDVNEKNGPNSPSLQLYKIEKMETILSELKELLKENFDVE
jgi:hypothetical protein